MDVLPLVLLQELVLTEQALSFVSNEIAKYLEGVPLGNRLPFIQLSDLGDPTPDIFDLR